MTKQFTAAAILKLAQKEKINLNDLANMHLPDDLKSEKWNNIKIKDLLCHHSGLINNDECKNFMDAKNMKLDAKDKFEPSKIDLIEFFKKED